MLSVFLAANLVVPMRCETTKELETREIFGEKAEELLSVGGKTAREMAGKSFKGNGNLRCYCTYRDGKSSSHHRSLQEAKAGRDDGPTGALVAP